MIVEGIMYNVEKVGGRGEIFLVNFYNFCVKNIFIYRRQSWKHKRQLKIFLHFLLEKFFPVVYIFKVEENEFFGLIFVF